MEITNKRINNINFGWNYKMHAEMVKQVGSDMFMPPKVLSIIARGVKKPDFQENFLFGHKHFYFPQSINKSFLDFSGKQNAKYMYEKHVNLMKKAFQKGKQKKMFDEAGKALHYLQDITQPDHIVQGSLFQKLKTFIPHVKFEKTVLLNQNNFYSGCKPINLKSNSFDELFTETLKMSQQNPIPEQKNRINWGQIGQRSTNLAVSATKNFLNLLERYIKQNI